MRNTTSDTIDIFQLQSYIEKGTNTFSCCNFPIFYKLYGEHSKPKLALWWLIELKIMEISVKNTGIGHIWFAEVHS